MLQVTGTQHDGEGAGGCHSKDVFVKFTFNDVNCDGDPYPLLWEYEKKIEINFKKTKAEKEVIDQSQDCQDCFVDPPPPFPYFKKRCFVPAVKNQLYFFPPK